MADTPAQRKERQRQRLEDSGLVRFELWTTPNNKQALKQAEKLLRDDTHTIEVIEND